MRRTAFGPSWSKFAHCERIGEFNDTLPCLAGSVMVKIADSTPVQYNTLAMAVRSRHLVMPRFL